MRRLLLVVLLGVAWLVAAGAAWAGPFEEARAAEERYAFREALELYERDPNGAERARWLKAHGEGGYEPLVQLERLRRTPEPAMADIDKLAMDADEFPPGLVRVEAWVFAADAYARKDQPQDAIPLWRKAARDPKADPVLARSAIRSSVRTHLAAGEIESAKVDMSWFYDETSAREIERLVRRKRLHYTSIALIVVVLAAVGHAVARARRLGVTRRSAVYVVAFSGFVALGGAALARGYEGATAAPFLWFGLALVPLLLAARAWANAGGAPRWARAAACVASVAAAAFLVLEQTGHLDGLGL